MNKDLPSSPNPFSQIWEKGSETFKVPLPDLGEGFRVRAKTTVLNLDEVYQVNLKLLNWVRGGRRQEEEFTGEYSPNCQHRKLASLFSNTSAISNSTKLCTLIGTAVLCLYHVCLVS
jgi:hypothetical protein